MKSYIVPLFGLIASVAASPVPAADMVERQVVTCKPNFQGSAVKLYSLLPNQYTWTVPSNANVGTYVTNNLPSHAEAASFLWPMDGSVAGYYNARLFGAAANNLVVGQDAQGKLQLTAVNWSGNNPSYNIVCTTCAAPGAVAATGATIASGCTISEVVGNRNVQRMPNGDLQFQTPTTSDNQKWKFVAA